MDRNTCILILVAGAICLIAFIIGSLAGLFSAVINNFIMGWVL